MGDVQQWGNNKNQKNGDNYPRRKQSGQKFNENSPNNYSPSTSYNYQNGKSRGNSRNLPRRRIDRYKRESIGSYDRLIKQNDLMIKLLKEIRDRLPEVPKTNVEKVRDTVKNHSNKTEKTEIQPVTPKNSFESSHEAKEPEKVKVATPLEDVDEQAPIEQESVENTEEGPASQENR